MEYQTDLEKIIAENKQLRQTVDTLGLTVLELEQLKKENEELKQSLSDFAGEFLNLETLNQQNENLKETVKQLRKQLEAYQKQSRRQYESDRDHLPYHDYDRD